uniref:Uncharacterized protein n=1 Tax=Rattus norvegicus TaxID=10116 RepID=O08622_RAT|nr:hypothetical protein [Rattus norvegicus]
MGGLSCLLRT